LLICAPYCAPFHTKLLAALQPKDHHTIKAEAFKPVERELIFDIDMTDYDDVRTCCSGAKICPRCWSFMNMAVKVVDTALRGA